MTAATLTRELRFQAPAKDAAPDAPIPCTIATTAAVTRYGTVEVLDCSPGGVDLSRAPLPLIIGHDAGRLSIGLVENLQATGDRVTGAVRFGTSLEAQQVRADVVAGIHRSLSVGYALLDQGTPIEGGAIYRWQPHEVSLVPVPADPAAGFFRSLQNTTTTMTTTTMTTNTTNRDAAEITALANHHNMPELGATLIQRGATIAQAGRAVLDELATRDRASGGHLNLTRTNTHHGASHSEAELIVETLVQRMGGKVKGETIRNTDLTGLAVRSLEMAGQRISHTANRDDVFNAAFRRGGYMTTSDFPSMLGTAVGRVLHEAYAASPSALKTIARLANLPDFREKSTVRLSGAPSLEQVNEAGEFKFGAMTDTANGWRLFTYGRIIALSRQAMINDDLQGFATLLRKFGEAASRREADELVSVLTSPPTIDGAALFDAGRHTLITSGALSASSLSAAVTALRMQADLDGGLVVQEPGYLVVPAALESVARQMMTNFNPTTTADVQPYTLGVVVDPRLDAASVTTWYLAAANQSALEYGYLDGAEGPQITEKEGFEVDGMQIKARLDFGCGFVSPVGWVKATA